MVEITSCSSSAAVSNPNAASKFPYVRFSGVRARVRNESWRSLRVWAGLSEGRLDVEW